MPERKNDLILLVDDDLSVLQIFGQALILAGLNVETASSGGEALAKIEALAPRLVLLDLMLPDYGGFELLELIRRRDASAVPSVIVITGRFNDEPTKEALRREPNVVAYLEKPVRPDELLSVVRRTLGQAPVARAR